MAGFIHEFRARMVESYINSYLAARGGDVAIIMRKNLIGSAVKGEGLYIICMADYSEILINHYFSCER